MVIVPRREILVELEEAIFGRTQLLRTRVISMALLRLTSAVTSVAQQIAVNDVVETGTLSAVRILMKVWDTRS